MSLYGTIFVLAWFTARQCDIIVEGKNDTHNETRFVYFTLFSTSEVA